MGRRSHFAHNADDDRGSPLTPNEIAKQEFGRHLQKLLDERNWSQSDLSRATADATGKGIGRDAISTYINGRSFPTPSSLNLLCKAFDLPREEVLPNSLTNATREERPAFEMRAVAGQPGRAWVSMSRLMSFEAATAIAQILAKEDGRLSGRQHHDDETSHPA